MGGSVERGPRGVRYEIHQTWGADPALPSLQGHIPGTDTVRQCHTDTVSRGTCGNSREVTDPGLCTWLLVPGARPAQVCQLQFQAWQPSAQ